MENKKEYNIKNWNSRVKIHLKSKDIYNLEDFRKGKLSFVSNEHKELLKFTEIKDKKLLHLQCHFGLDTMSFSRLGALPTGVDFSDEAIKVAQNLSKELQIPTEFVLSDVLELDLNQKFDIVFTSLGVLPWISDIKKWAKVISQHLKEGGILYLKDSHPIIHSLDSNENLSDPLIYRFPYFSEGKEHRYESPWTYAHDGTKEELEHRIHFEWHHTLSDVFNALLSERLKIIHFDESPYGFFQYFEFMKKDDLGRWVLPSTYSKHVPLTFTIVALRE